MKTQIQNISGGQLYRGYLPPHGRGLADGATIVIDGDLRSALAAGRNRYSRKTEITALDADCLAGKICLTEVVEDCCSSSSSSSSV
jgi:hypothetical protein